MNDDRLYGLLLKICRIAGVLTIALTIVGVWRNQTGVPCWDAWDGYINFYLNALSDGWTTWWRQHNEHHLVLSYLFFYADLRWFGGLSWLPLVGNLALAAGIWSLLALLWRRTRPDDLDQNASRAVFWVIGVACLSWMQRENFTSGFQIAFFLACLLPLAAFSCMGGFAAERERKGLFVAAAVFGVLSAGTLANGIAMPALLLAFGLFLRLRAWQLAVLALLAVATPVIYLHGYSVPPGHDSPTHVWLSTPGQAAGFAVTFLGGALSQLQLRTEISAMAGTAIMGVLFFVGVPRVLKAPAAPWAAVPAAFLGYLVLAALATASGRTSMGLDVAVAGRYATVSLMALTTAWLLILAWTRAPWLRRGVLIIATAACIGNLVVQALALNNVTARNNALRLGQLALSLDVNDAPALEVLYPGNEHLRVVAARARERQLGLFGDWPYRDARTLVGQPAAQIAQVDCATVIDSSTPVPGQDALRIEGHLANAAPAPYRGFVWLIDADDRIAGLALAGMPRPFAQGAEEIADNGFVGYTPTGQPVQRAVCAAKP